MTYEEQLEKWLEGESIHDEETNTCCPDFSCCDPELQTHKEKRELFYEAYKSGDSVIAGNLMSGFLNLALKKLCPNANFTIIKDTDLEDKLLGTDEQDYKNN